MPAMNLRLDQQSVSVSAQRTTPISHRHLVPGVNHAVNLVASTSAHPSSVHGATAGLRRTKAAQRSRQQVIVSAVSTSAPAKTFQQEYNLPDGKKLKAAVETRDDGSQQITFRTDLPAGRLLLHWGVQGGGSGWHLPRSRPEHTSQYKDRALQSPFNNNEVRLNLPADEASSAINFVLKDAGSNRWYDCNGSNFVLQLRGGSGNKAVEGITVAGGGQAPAAAVTQLPDELCGKWAYIKWEANGRKNSSWAESQADYEKGVLEMRLALTAGRSMDDLWKVVNGQQQYRDFMNAVQQANSQQSQQQAPPPQEQQKQQEQPKAEQQQQPKAQKQQPSTPTEVGKSLDGVQQRNPLDMIKKAAAAPNLANAKNDPEPEKPLAFLVQKFAVDSTTKWRRTYAMGGKSELLVAVRQEKEGGDVQVIMVTDLAAEEVLHWGVSPPGSRDQFQLPSEDIWPEEGNTDQAGSGAVDTSFVKAANEVAGVSIADAKVPLQIIIIKLPADHNVGGITFVIRSKDNTMWYKDGGKNFFVPVPGKHAELKKEEDPLGGIKDNLSRDIVEAENSSAWTLMHRFNRVADLISTIQSGAYNMPLEDAYSRLYVWLRYSSTRHLTWQRNYNTQPRILSGAQERLTNSIADAHSKTTGEAQEWLRLMLTTVGRGGGDGQKIRDEILNIMHRNHIKESAGHWMEYWHQKLHNNTTPDDVPICEAYIAFLKANGDKGAYWRVLSDAGITKQRLETYDRPIPVEPDTTPWQDKKDALIGEFSNYLNILKSVHSGADLHTSMQRSGDQVPGSAKGFLAYVASHRTDSQVLPLMEAAVEARTELAPAARGKRELLYLDLALEDIVRTAAERGVGSAGFGAAALMRPLLQNLAITLGDNEEVCYCLKSWNELPSSIIYGGRPTADEALLAVAVLDRIRRAISVVSDKVVARIGGVSAAYGKAFKIESWAVDLFSEEVVRGGPAFAVSLVISAIEPTIRSAAKLGAWQVISPQPAYGKVVVVSGLAEVQEKVYDEPTVLIANQVTGEEEIPEGAVAVLTPDAPDVLSHVSVRARNMKVLFATCHDAAPLAEISKMAGQWLSFSTTASGDVKWTDVKPAEDAGAAESAGASGKKLQITIPKWSGKWVVPMDGYEDGVVGAKSKNLALLRKSLPDTVTLPASITLPFGCFEQALSLPENKKIKRRLQRFVARVDGRKPAADLLSAANAIKSFMDNSIEEEDELTDTPASELLALCRELAEQVQIPPTIKQELASAMETAGIPPPKDEAGWERAFKALRGVWASKYNDRAYYSLRKNGLNFDDVRMAVLVQRVVPAQYAFVIHTRNPSNNNENEIFAELVLGLGESLVSGMVAGSAMAFKAEKNALDKPEVLCFPSKSEGMFVPDSLIFRSDSNGEDLEGYAGAGLYESITVDESKLKRVDYMSDRIVKDVAFRNSILGKILKVGLDIEKALGVAQDIEGVVDQDGNVTVVQTRPQV